MPIAFIDLVTQRRLMGPGLMSAIEAVIESGAFILGPEVQNLEAALADFGQAGHVLTCANGTDALLLPLKAWGLGPGDAVFCPSFTFASTAEVVALTGASPVFVDIDPKTYNLDPKALELAIDEIKDFGHLTPRAVIAVDLFGQPANYPEISKICREAGLKLVADSAQAFGCRLHGHHPLHWADVATTSFYPAKPLGCYGDGGAILTEDFGLAELIRSLRVHGQAVAGDLAGETFAHDPKYLNIRVGYNSRLDTIQAAILLEKLKLFPQEITQRNQVARRYNEAFADAKRVTCTPEVIEGGLSTWAQYTIEHQDRDGLGRFLKDKGVPTAVYYPLPLHLQKAYQPYFVAGGKLPVTEAAATRVISLPMHPYLDEKTQDQIIKAVLDFA